VEGSGPRWSPPPTAANRRGGGAALKDWEEVPRNDYLEEALSLSVRERDRLSEALARLPPRVVDAHTHIARQQDLVAPPSSLLGEVVSTFPFYSLDDARRVRGALWPGRSVCAVRMALPVDGYHHRAVNQYLIESVRLHGDLVAGYGLPDDIDYTTELVRSGRVRALKMYHRYRERRARRILDVFPEPVLAAAQEASTPIILHLPTPLASGMPEVAALREAFPELTVILAHLGGGGAERYQPEAATLFQALARYPRILVDTAFVMDAELLRAVLAALGPARVLFGTDEPMSLIRAVNYQHPTLGPRLYGPRYHWSRDDRPPDSVLRAEKAILHLQQLEALLTALSDYDSASLDQVFYRNAALAFRLNDNE
jgi:uncharacterized protein